MWTKTPYGAPDSGHWTISNGHIQFDIHLTIDGSHGTGYIVSPAEADAYADFMLLQLNKREAIDFRPVIKQEYARHGRPLELGRLNYVLISRGAKACGTLDPDEIMSHFEEELTAEEYENIDSFLRWCHQEDKRFGHGNYEERYTEWLRSLG